MQGVVNDYLKKGQTLLLPAYTGARLWWDTLCSYFYSLEEANRWIHSVTSVRVFSPVLRNICITYLAEHINAIVKKIFNMKPLYLSSSEHTCTRVHACARTHTHTHTHTSLLSHPHSDIEALLCNDSNVFISMCNNGKVVIYELKSKLSQRNFHL